MSDLKFNYVDALKELEDIRKPLEPGLPTPPGEKMILVSSAISLKRIADTLEKFLRQYEINE